MTAYKRGPLEIVIAIDESGLSYLIKTKLLDDLCANYMMLSLAYEEVSDKTPGNIMYKHRDNKLHHSKSLSDISDLQSLS